MRKTLLWLDDYRNPFDLFPDWLVFSPIGRDVDIVWVKSYDEFCDFINKQIPDAVCFDHDLKDIDDENYENEKTGYDCAKELVRVCMEKNIKLPAFNSQSSNPAGRDNIMCYLNNYKKHCEDNN